MPTNKNQEQLGSFMAYCQANPDERFWQALRNWSGYAGIYGMTKSCKALERPELKDFEDTFYKN